MVRAYISSHFYFIFVVGGWAKKSSRVDVRFGGVIHPPVVDGAIYIVLVSAVYK
jgi:hypothetical protein